MKHSFMTVGDFAAYCRQHRVGDNYLVETTSGFAPISGMYHSYNGGDCIVECDYMKTLDFFERLPFNEMVYIHRVYGTEVWSRSHDGFVFIEEIQDASI